MPVGCLLALHLSRCLQQWQWGKQHMIHLPSRASIQHALLPCSCPGRCHGGSPPPAGVRWRGCAPSSGPTAPRATSAAQPTGTSSRRAGQCIFASCCSCGAQAQCAPAGQDVAMQLWCVVMSSADTLHVREACLTCGTASTGQVSGGTTEAVLQGYSALMGRVSLTAQLPASTYV